GARGKGVTAAARPSAISGARGGCQGPGDRAPRREEFDSPPQPSSIGSDLRRAELDGRPTEKDMSSRLRTFLLLAATGLGAGLPACAAQSSYTEEEVAALEERIAELERTNGRNRVRLEDMEERIFLLQ